MLAAGDDVAENAAAMTIAYEQAFARRSTWRERASAIDHLRDLADLLDSADSRCPLIEQALARLRTWDGKHVPLDGQAATIAGRNG